MENTLTKYGQQEAADAFESPDWFPKSSKWTLTTVYQLCHRQKDHALKKTKINGKNNTFQSYLIFIINVF